jgi:hypothetical protein
MATPTSQTVWDYHPALRAVTAAFDQTAASRQGRVVLVAGGPASGRTGLARALAARLAVHPARPVLVAGGFPQDGDWEPWPPPDRPAGRAAAGRGRSCCQGA